MNPGVLRDPQVLDPTSGECPLTWNWDQHRSLSCSILRPKKESRPNSTSKRSSRNGGGLRFHRQDQKAANTRCLLDIAGMRRCLEGANDPLVPFFAPYRIASHRADTVQGTGAGNTTVPHDLQMQLASCPRDQGGFCLRVLRFHTVASRQKMIPDHAPSPGYVHDRPERCGAKKDDARGKRTLPTKQGQPPAAGRGRSSSSEPRR